MRVLLRDQISQSYYQGPDRWTSEPDMAFDFRFIGRALSYCRTGSLKGVELVFAYENPQQVIAVPLEGAAVGIAATAA